MKKILFLFLFLTIYIHGNGQQLYKGIYTEQTILSDSHCGHLKPNSCPDYAIMFELKPCCSYVTGMNLYIRIDSIIGPPNSIMLWRKPDYVNDFIYVNDTININKGYDMYFTFLNTATLYISFIAIGIPQISGEKYHCAYNIWDFMMADDPCGCHHRAIVLQDTAKNCKVSDNNMIIKDKFHKNELDIFPNPAISYITIKPDNHTIIKEVFFINILDQVQIKKDYSEIIDITDIPKGIYIVKIMTDNEITYRKIIIDSEK